MITLSRQPRITVEVGSAARAADAKMLLQDVQDTIAGLIKAEVAHQKSTFNNPPSLYTVNNMRTSMREFSPTGVVRKAEVFFGTAFGEFDKRVAEYALHQLLRFIKRQTTARTGKLSKESSWVWRLMAPNGMSAEVNINRLKVLKPGWQLILVPRGVVDHKGANYATVAANRSSRKGSRRIKKGKNSGESRATSTTFYKMAANAVNARWRGKYTCVAPTVSDFSNPGGGFSASKHGLRVLAIRTYSSKRRRR